MIVVSDSTPLIALAAVGHLRLLHTLFGTVYVPEAVYREVAEEGAGRPGAAEVTSAPWVHSM